MSSNTITHWFKPVKHPNTNMGGVQTVNSCSNDKDPIPVKSENRVSSKPSGANSNLNVKRNVTLKTIKLECIQSTYELKEICKRQNVKFNGIPCHLDELKKLRDAEEESSDDEYPDEYEVEEILKCRRLTGKLEYRVKWKGWSSKFNTWETLSNLQNCKDIVDQFHINHQIEENGFKRKRESTEEFIKKQKSLIDRVICDLVKREDIGCILKLLGISYSSFASQPKSIKLLIKDARKILNSHSRWTKCNVLLQELISTKNGKLDEFLSFVDKRKETLSKLSEWEKSINLLLGSNGKVKVENYVDLEGPPENFIYITDYKAKDGIEISDDPPVGCGCDNCYDKRKFCCAQQSGFTFAYNRFGSLVVEPGHPIYECNKKCLCGSDCLNRIVQKGRQVPLSIFRTDNGCGWGVRTLEKIKKGTFVMEYVGEVITNEEAEQRGKAYDAAGRTYLFDLDYDEKECLYTVDATYYGNVAHFMNHSCDPNLVVYGVWINNLDPKMPRLAFFAAKDIKKLEELSFDYTRSSTANVAEAAGTPKFDGGEISCSPETSLPFDRNFSFKCKCRASNCRGYVF